MTMQGECRQSGRIALIKGAASGQEETVAECEKGIYVRRLPTRQWSLTGLLGGERWAVDDRVCNVWAHDQ